MTNKASAHGRALNNSTAYIEIASMTGNVVKEFKEIFTTLRSYPNLIIDVRKNTGGSSTISEQLVSYLIDEPIKGCVSRKKIAPSKIKYEGNLYVLAGVKTASAAESFVLDLVESGRDVTLVGSSTTGDTGNGPANFKTSGGISFRIPTRQPPQMSFKNFPMEGVGIPTQFNVAQSVDDYLKDIDTALEFVLLKTENY
jgi:carboxyl-terminal processing protease